MGGTDELISKREGQVVFPTTSFCPLPPRVNKSSPPTIFKYNNQQEFFALQANPHNPLGG